MQLKVNELQSDHKSLIGSCLTQYDPRHDTLRQYRLGLSQKLFSVPCNGCRGAKPLPLAGGLEIIAELQDTSLHFSKSCMPLQLQLSKMSPSLSCS